ncbi:MAG: recombination protein RecR [Saprospiraceae bacterium]|nr:recombination protein RecR [Saprospiraceae bacterium]
MKIQSKNLESIVQAFSDLPGIGQKSALRIAIHMLSQPREKIDYFISSLNSVSEIKRCIHCHNLSDGDICAICQDKSRNQSLICVVENIQDIMAIEETGQYRGGYHVLGGVISPIEGVGPEQLNIESLLDRVNKGLVNEIIMAISPTIDGETTVYYLSKMLKTSQVRISQIARGVAFGGELQYTDEITLGRSILARLPYAVNGND